MSEKKSIAETVDRVAVKLLEKVKASAEADQVRFEINDQNRAWAGFFLRYGARYLLWRHWNQNRGFPLKMQVDDFGKTAEEMSGLLRTITPAPFGIYVFGFHSSGKTHVIGRIAKAIGAYSVKMSRFGAMYRASDGKTWCNEIAESAQERPIFFDDVGSEEHNIDFNDRAVVVNMFHGAIDYFKDCKHPIIMTSNIVPYFMIRESKRRSIEGSGEEWPGILKLNDMPDAIDKFNDDYGSRVAYRLNNYFVPVFSGVNPYKEGGR